jgi:endonuclease YncB( thermonuclease family)
MFFTLHRVVRILGLVVLAAVAFLAWQRPALFDPAVDLVAALRSGNTIQGTVLTSITGQVVRVFDGTGFQLRDEQRRSFNVRLAGLDAPSLTSRNRQERERASISRSNLCELVLSNQVRLEVTLTNAARTALATAYLGRTNVNAALLESGHFTLRPDYMVGLPLRTRYTLVRADRQGRLNAAAASRPSAPP